jgi:type III pantothenate kinase
MDNSSSAYQWVVDAGNTSIKTALFLSNECLEINHWSYVDFESGWRSYWEHWHCPNVVISSVGNLLPQEFLSIGKVLEPGLLKEWHWEYEVKESLGVDRIAAVLGAAHFFPKDQKILVVDMGTCVTYTMRNGKEILGLSIVPGLEMRWRAMHHFTQKLPLVTWATSVDKRGTLQNIWEGGKRGWQIEQLNWITYFCQLYHIDRVVLTGSDVVHLEIKEHANWEKIPYLNLHGLKAWMDV